MIKMPNPPIKLFWEKAPASFSSYEHWHPDLLKWFKVRNVDCEAQINTVAPVIRGGK